MTTDWEKKVAEYCRISLPEVERLDFIEYLRLRRDAFIYDLNQTKDGREYLDNAYRLTVTEMDSSALRDLFSKSPKTE